MSQVLNVQDLLRFLTQDAKLALATAIKAVPTLQKQSLSNVDSLSLAQLNVLEMVFGDVKSAKQVSNAAKRIKKKRGAPADEDEKPRDRPQKRAKVVDDGELTPEDLEASLALPKIEVTEDDIRSCVIRTNRAPLLLAFVLQLLRYTMPDQPLSSRLSLAQAVVSTNARAKAASIGIESGPSAGQEGWGQGQPVVKIMSRDIRVMKRWGYEWRPSVKIEDEESKVDDRTLVKVEDCEADTNLAMDHPTQTNSSPEIPALWGLDLEALKSSNKGTAAASSQVFNRLPIFTPQSARAYLLKSSETTRQGAEEPGNAKGRKNSASRVEKERNLALLLGALDKLYSSWQHVLGASELDQRAWSWYICVRPDIADGVAGWGGKGEVKLADILALCRTV